MLIRRGNPRGLPNQIPKFNGIEEIHPGAW